MDEIMISQASIFIDWSTGKLIGSEVHESMKTVGELRGIFCNRPAWDQMDRDTVVYRVQWIDPLSRDAEGGLLWGNTTVQPGVVGEEYFMTHGHFHRKRDRTEFYSTVAGHGLLLSMDSDRRCTVQEMSPGSLHHIGPGLAHRVVNTGDDALRFVACWPSDAGHDYGSIAQDGFSLRVMRQNGSPRIVRSS